VLHEGAVQVQDENLILDQEQIAQVQVGMKTAHGVKGSHRQRRASEYPASLHALREARLDPSAKVFTAWKVPGENPPPVHQSPGTPKMEGEYFRCWNSSPPNCLRNPKLGKESIHTQEPVAEKLPNQPTVAKAS
jgi:hypothetical protein